MSESDTSTDASERSETEDDNSTDDYTGSSGSGNEEETGEDENTSTTATSSSSDSSSASEDNGDDGNVERSEKEEYTGEDEEEYEEDEMDKENEERIKLSEIVDYVDRGLKLNAKKTLEKYDFAFDASDKDDILGQNTNVWNESLFVRPDAYCFTDDSDFERLVARRWVSALRGGEPETTTTTTTTTKSASASSGPFISTSSGKELPGDILYSIVLSLIYGAKPSFVYELVLFPFSSADDPNQDGNTVDEDFSFVKEVVKEALYKKMGKTYDNDDDKDDDNDMSLKLRYGLNGEKIYSLSHRHSPADALFIMQAVARATEALNDSHLTYELVEELKMIREVAQFSPSKKETVEQDMREAEEKHEKRMQRTKEILGLVRPRITRLERSVGNAVENVMGLNNFLATSGMNSNVDLRSLLNDRRFWQFWIATCFYYDQRRMPPLNLVGTSKGTAYVCPDYKIFQFISGWDFYLFYDPDQATDLAKEALKSEIPTEENMAYHTSERKFGISRPYLAEMARMFENFVLYDTRCLLPSENDPFYDARTIPFHDSPFKVLVDPDPPTYLYPVEFVIVHGEFDEELRNDVLSNITPVKQYQVISLIKRRTLYNPSGASNFVLQNPNNYYDESSPYHEAFVILRRDDGGETEEDLPDGKYPRIEYDAFGYEREQEFEDESARGPDAPKQLVRGDPEDDLLESPLFPYSGTVEDDFDRFVSYGPNPKTMNYALRGYGYESPYNESYKVYKNWFLHCSKTAWDGASITIRKTGRVFGEGGEVVGRTTCVEPDCLFELNKGYVHDEFYIESCPLYSVPMMNAVIKYSQKHPGVFPPYVPFLNAYDEVHSAITEPGSAAVSLDFGNRNVTIDDNGERFNRYYSVRQYVFAQGKDEKMYWHSKLMESKSAANVRALEGGGGSTFNRLLKWMDQHRSRSSFRKSSLFDSVRNYSVLLAKLMDAKFRIDPRKKEFVYVYSQHAFASLHESLPSSFGSSFDSVNKSAKDTGFVTMVGPHHVGLWNLKTRNYEIVSLPFVMVDLDFNHVLHAYCASKASGKDALTNRAEEELKSKRFLYLKDKWHSLMTNTVGVTTTWMEYAKLCKRKAFLYAHDVSSDAFPILDEDGSLLSEDDMIAGDFINSEYDAASNTNCTFTGSKYDLFYGKSPFTVTKTGKIVVSLDLECYVNACFRTLLSSNTKDVFRRYVEASSDRGENEKDAYPPWNGFVDFDRSKKKNKEEEEGEGGKGEAEEETIWIPECSRIFFSYDAKFENADPKDDSASYTVEQTFLGIFDSNNINGNHFVVSDEQRSSYDNDHDAGKTPSSVIGVSSYRDRLNSVPVKVHNVSKALLGEFNDQERGPFQLSSKQRGFPSAAHFPLYYDVAIGRTSEPNYQAFPETDDQQQKQQERDQRQRRPGGFKTRVTPSTPSILEKRKQTQTTTTTTATTATTTATTASTTATEVHRTRLRCLNPIVRLDVAEEDTVSGSLVLHFTFLHCQTLKCAFQGCHAIKEYGEIRAMPPSYVVNYFHSNRKFKSIVALYEECTKEVVEHRSLGRVPTKGGSNSEDEDDYFLKRTGGNPNDAAMRGLMRDKKRALSVAYAHLFDYYYGFVDKMSVRLAKCKIGNVTGERRGAPYRELVFVYDVTSLNACFLRASKIAEKERTPENKYYKLADWWKTFKYKHEHGSGLEDPNVFVTLKTNADADVFVDAVTTVSSALQSKDGYFRMPKRYDNLVKPFNFMESSLSVDPAGCHPEYDFFDCKTLEEALSSGLVRFPLRVDGTTEEDEERSYENAPPVVMKCFTGYYVPTKKVDDFIRNASESRNQDDIFSRGFSRKTLKSRARTLRPFGSPESPDSPDSPWDASRFDMQDEMTPEPGLKAMSDVLVAVNTSSAFSSFESILGGYSLYDINTYNAEDENGDRGNTEYSNETEDVYYSKHAARNNGALVPRVSERYVDPYNDEGFFFRDFRGQAIGEKGGNNNNDGDVSLIMERYPNGESFERHYYDEGYPYHRDELFEDEVYDGVNCGTPRFPYLKSMHCSDVVSTLCQPPVTFFNVTCGKYTGTALLSKPIKMACVFGDLVIGFHRNELLFYKLNVTLFEARDYTRVSAERRKKLSRSQNTPVRTKKDKGALSAEDEPEIAASGFSIENGRFGEGKALSSLILSSSESSVTDTPFNVLRKEQFRGVEKVSPALSVPLYKESVQFRTPCQSNLNVLHVPWNEEAVRCCAAVGDRGEKYLVFSRSWEMVRPKFGFSQRMNVTTSKFKDDKRRVDNEGEAFKYYDSFDPFFSDTVSPLENLMTCSCPNYYVCVKIPSDL